MPDGQAGAWRDAAPAGAAATIAGRDAEPMGPPGGAAARATATLRGRLLRIAVLPVLAVGLLAAALMARNVVQDERRDLLRRLDFAVQDGRKRIAAVADRMAGYGIALAQRRDIQAAILRHEAAGLQRELAELYRDLRGNDQLLRVLAATDAAGEVLAQGVAGGVVPLQAAPSDAPGRQVGLLPAGEGVKLGASVPVTPAGAGAPAGHVHVLARLDGALARELAGHLGAHVALLDGRGATGATFPLELAEAPPWLREAVQRRRAGTGELLVEGVPHLGQSLPLLDPGGVVRAQLLVLLPAPAPAELARMAGSAMLLTGAVLIFVTLPLTWHAARRLAAPLEALAGTLRGLALGRHAAPAPALPADSPVELLALSAAVTEFRASLQQREKLEKRLHWLANFDTLTGIPNRNLFQERLADALGGAAEGRAAVALHVLDLDDFRRINESFGHGVGDELLCHVGARLTRLVRAGDTVARLGADEFAVLQRDLPEGHDPAEMARRLQEELGGPVELGPRRLTIGACIGTALAGRRGPDAAEALLREAEMALKQARAEGSGRIRAFEPAMQEQARDRRLLEADLRHAIAADELRLVFQPQFGVPDRRLCGAEALLRWRHPTRGEVRPDIFIGIAEQAGLIVPIGEWVLREAARAAARWPGVRIACNVSPIQLQDPRFLRILRDALADAGLPPGPAGAGGQLEIEVTESVLVTDTSATAALFEQIRALGVRIALDDFGTGHSSLAQLQRFRFDKIKLDRAFIRPLGESRTAASLVRAVAGMTRALGVKLNAEGVETEEQLGVLAAEGVAEVQGFLLGRPAEAADFAALVAAAGALPAPG